MTNLIKIAASTIRKDCRAVGAIEYALLASFLSLGVVLGATALGTGIGNYFSNLGVAMVGWAIG